VNPAPDPVLTAIAEYVCHQTAFHDKAYDSARDCLLDALGCACAALSNTDCRRHIGPIVPGAVLPGGARVPGTDLELEPVHAAFNLGCLIRWLDYNDTWLAAEWGHPSDNLGAILACADYLSRTQRTRGQAPLKIRDVLNALIQAYEIQGVLALSNSFNILGLDHVILVRLASAAVTARLLGGNEACVIAAASQAFLDGGNLRAYRHAPNTGPRKSWAAGDATARGLRLALMSAAGEPGYPQALSAPRYGFQDALLQGKPLEIPQAFDSYIVERVLFKLDYPCEFHAQTAAEAAIRLHPSIEGRLNRIERIVLNTQLPAIRIIDKRGPLRNPADRDHCLQYIVAIGLLYGELQYRHFEEPIALDPRIETLRAMMEAKEDPSFSKDYLNPDLRSVANRVTLHFRDGSVLEEVVEFPIGHPRRRAEGRPRLLAKFAENLQSRFSASEIDRFLGLFADREALEAMHVDEFVGLWVRPD
jgi:2-methylcitrate dehydratase